MDNCHVFVDESGDFGFSSTTSKYTVLAAIIAQEIDRLGRIPRQIRRRNTRGRILRKVGELKFNTANDHIRREILKAVARTQDIRIGCIILDKSKLGDLCSHNGELLYLQMSVQLMKEIAGFERIRRRMEVTFHRTPFYYRHEGDYEQFIQSAVSEEFDRLRIIAPEISVHVKSSQTSDGVRIADFVAGAIHRKYSKDDSVYHELIKESIIFEKQFAIR